MQVRLGSATPRFAVVMGLAAIVSACGGGGAASPRSAVATPAPFPPWTDASAVAVFNEVTVDLDSVAVEARPDVASFSTPFREQARAMMDARPIEDLPRDGEPSNGILVLAHVTRYAYQAGQNAFTFQDVTLSLTFEVRVYDLREVRRATRFDPIRQATVAVPDTGDARVVAQGEYSISLQVFHDAHNRAQAWHDEIAPEVARQMLNQAASTLRNGIDFVRSGEPTVVQDVPPES